MTIPGPQSQPSTESLPPDGTYRMRKKQPSSWSGVLFSFVIALGLGTLFLGFGIFLGCGLYTDITEARAVKGWNKVPAMITHLEVELYQRKLFAFCTCAVSYEYEVDGTKYVGEGLGISSSNNFERKRGRELTHYFKSKRPFRCYVDPDDPSNAVLYGGLCLEDLGIGLIIVLGCGGAAAVAFSVAFSVPFSLISEHRRGNATPEPRPDKPRRIKRERAEGRMESLDLSMLLLVGAVAVIWNAIFIPIVVIEILPEIVHGNDYFVTSLLFPAIGLVAAVAFVYLLLRHLGYDVSVFQVDEVQTHGIAAASVFQFDKVHAIIGGPFSGTLTTKVKLPPNGLFKVKLENRRVRAKSNDDASLANVFKLILGLRGIYLHFPKTEFTHPANAMRRCARSRIF